MPKNIPSLDSLIPKPVKPGQIVRPTLLNKRKTLQLYRTVFAETVGTGEAQSANVVWVDGENELLVRDPKIRMLFRDGFVLIGIPVFCEQTGEVEVVVPFAMGRPDAPLGLIMAIEDRPRGPTEIVEKWGDPLTAAAWQTLIRMVARIAADSGVDNQKQAYLPASVTASRAGLAVLPQARHLFDRRQDDHKR